MKDKLIYKAIKIPIVLIVIFTLMILVAKGFTLVTIEKVLQRIEK